MIDGIAAFLRFDRSVFALVFTLGMCAVAMLLSVPAIVLFPAVDECDRELKRRNIVSSQHVSLEDWFPRRMARILLVLVATIGLLVAFR